MLKAGLISWWGWLQLGGRLFTSVGSAGASAIPRRFVLFTVAWCVFGVLNLMHWFGFLLDEILFPCYRRVRVSRPLFIVGVPRSGTTHLQRVLARDPQFTTLTLFDCVLAPSIVERYLLTALARLVRPVASRFQGARTRFDEIHEIGLAEPEEDFLLLLYLQACFLTVVPCPDDPHSWRLSRFDDAFAPGYRAAVMKFYHRCLQKHLYYHGEQLRLLSKNPSFTPMLESLRVEFPDCVIVACIRAPEQTVPSQLSALVPALALLGAGMPAGHFQENLIQMLHRYYRKIIAAPDVCLIEMTDLNADLAGTVTRLADFSGHPMTEAFREQLSRLAAAGRQYRSGHQYSLADFNLSSLDIRQRFADVWPLSVATSGTES